MAAPSLVAAALGEPAPSHVRMASRTMYVARREDVGADNIICGLASDPDADAPHLLPPGDPASGLVLAVADGTPRDPLSRRRQRRLTAPLRLLRRLVWHRIGIAFLTLTAVLAVGFVLLISVPVVRGGGNALYLTFLDAAGAAVTGTSVPTPEKWAQFLLTFDGMAFLPFVTAAIVSSRIPGSRASDRVPLAGTSSSPASAASARASSASCTTWGWRWWASTRAPTPPAYRSHGCSACTSSSARRTRRKRCARPGSPPARPSCQ